LRKEHAIKEYIRFLGYGAIRTSPDPSYPTSPEVSSMDGT
jgi:hypothetical protein